GAARARVAEHFSAHVGVGVGRGGTALGSGSNGGVGTELHLAMQQALDAAIVHDQNDEVGGFAADLKADAAAFERVHGGRPPRAAEAVAGAADHGAAAVAAADDERSLQYGRHDDDAARFVEQILRNVVRDVENFLHDDASVV